MKYNAVIFDLDGVICFTDQYHYLAWKLMADKIGVPFDKKKNNRLRGVSRRESLEIILEDSSKSYSEEEKQELLTYKNEQYISFIQNMSESDLSDEVKETLDELHRRGCLLAIGSSSKNAKLILQRLGLENYFDAISDGTNIVNSKPDPEVFLKAAEFLGKAPEECLVVEDAKAGIDAAVAGGFDSAGLSEAAEYERTTYSLKTFGDLKEVCK